MSLPSLSNAGPFPMQKPEYDKREHQIQLAARRTSSCQDLLLLPQPRPAYTSGRIAQERTRLVKTDADLVATARDGQSTYHGPGQLAGYPLLDLARTSQPWASETTYVAGEHGPHHVSSKHTGMQLQKLLVSASRCAIG